LKETNTQYISAHGHVLQDSQSSGGEEAQTIRDDPHPAAAPRGQERAAWEICPDLEWSKESIALRRDLGLDLLDKAQKAVSTGHSIPNLTRRERQSNCDLWSSPFTVSYLNVGFRHLEGSLLGIVDFVMRHRPDVLFLGDLVTTRDHIGRLSKRLESLLKDEWFVLTSISDSPGRPVEIGVVIHCSLANCITTTQVTTPGDAEQEVWSRAVNGRIMHLQLSRPELPYTWHIVGIYQHVASSYTVQARALVRQSVQHIWTW
jgi:hypothetical protein